MSKLVSLSEAASIGIHSMVLIARSEEKIINVNRIAELTGASRHHIAKILQRLVKDKYLDSNRGPGGGFILNKEPSEINLLDIYECIEGQVEINECPLDRRICPFDKCITGNILNKITGELKSYLQKQTLDKYL